MVDTDVSDAIRKAVNDIPKPTARDTAPTSDPKREDRAAIMALMIHVQQTRTNNSPWSSRDQLVAEYLMTWADQL